MDIALGHCTVDYSGNELFQEFLSQVGLLLQEELGLAEGESLELLAKHIGKHQINEKRMGCIHRLNQTNRYVDALTHCLLPELQNIIGPDILVQNRINLSIQMPDDEGSVLPLHSDCWEDESPFEVNVWVPITKTANSNSMLLADKSVSAEVNGRFLRNELARNHILEACGDRVQAVTSFPGQVLFFSPTLVHGNVVNTTRQTRVSLNIRYKSLFSPTLYGSKGIGSFFRVFQLSGLVRCGLDYLSIDA